MTHSTSLKDHDLLKKCSGNLIISCDTNTPSEWAMPDSKLEKALFRIHVTKKLIEFFELEERGKEKVVNELLNPYERGLESAMNDLGQLYEHPEYAQGYQDYLDLMAKVED